MSIQDISAEELAKLFHLYHQALVHGLDDHRSGEHILSWEKTPQDERKLMIAAAGWPSYIWRLGAARNYQAAATLPNPAKQIGVAENPFSAPQLTFTNSL
jgi:hypothetical protein